jgi:hypothetical protein
VRYYKGHIALSETRDVPVLLHVRNARAICFDQLCDLISLEIVTECPRSLRWRLARLEKAGLVARLAGQQHLPKPVFGITQQGLIFLESRGHYLFSLPSTTEVTLHSSQVPHALEMVNIRIALAKTGVLHSWESDLEITSKNLVLEGGLAKDFDAVAEIEVYERDKKTDAILYLTTNDDLLYLLALELRATRKRIGFALSEAFRRSLLETRTLTNSNNSEVVLLRAFLCGNQH